MKPVIFVDIDGTVADSFAYWVELYNWDHETYYNKSDIQDYDISKTFDDVGCFEDYFRNYKDVKPVAGSLEAIRILREKFRIVFVTQGFGYEWAQSWFKFEDKDFVQIEDRSLLRGFALIDDNPANLDVFQGERFLISQPWNTGRGLNDVEWETIVNHLA